MMKRWVNIVFMTMAKDEIIHFSTGVSREFENSLLANYAMVLFFFGVHSEAQISRYLLKRRQFSGFFEARILDFNMSKVICRGLDSDSNINLNMSKKIIKRGREAVRGNF